MATTTLKQWAEAHGPTATGRVVKRIERFAGNTVDAGTALAAEELVQMIKEVLSHVSKSHPEAKQ